MEQWILMRKGADYQALSEEFGILPVTARVIRNRGMITSQDFDEYLHGTIACFGQARDMKDMELACDILREKIEQHKKIRIIGDYDIDGVCATTILWKGLQSAGACVDAVIPHRVKDGYGLNKEMIERANIDGIDTILTCDNGIAAREEIAYAKMLGMTVIITDHHEVPYEDVQGERHYLIPEADAVVDPKQEACGYSFKGICGAFVAYKLIECFFALNAALVTDALVMDALWDELLQLAAFATVGDIMELKGENRALVKEGLSRMRNAKSHGIKALLSVLGLTGTCLSTYHLGYLLGPCINATGRIDTAERALELLMSQDDVTAMQLASELKAMNDSRKAFTEKGTEEAVAQITRGEHKDSKVLVIYLKDCHESIAGIVAGRIRERYGRPTLVITDAEDGLKGSGRSIETYHMYDALAAVGDIFTKFGGHAQAAGFSLPRERLEELRKRLNENCSLTQEDFRGKIYIDVDLPLSYVDTRLLDELTLMEPFGNGNEKPMFARKGLILTEGKLLGAEGKVGKYKVCETDGAVYELTMFYRNQEFLQFLREQHGADAVDGILGKRGGRIPISIAYYPQWNEYQGRKSIQIVIADYC